MHPTPGLATSLAMQAYLRHHGTPVCLHELLVQTVRQQHQRGEAVKPVFASPHPAEVAAARGSPAAPGPP